jgi:hypothetical protein
MVFLENMPLRPPGPLGQRVEVAPNTHSYGGVILPRISGKRLRISELDAALEDHSEKLITGTVFLRKILNYDF